MSGPEIDWGKLESLSPDPITLPCGHPSVEAARPGPDWFTAIEYGHQLGVRRSYAAKQLRDLHASGKLHVRFVHPRNYYRMID